MALQRLQMAPPNTKFDLDVEELQLIESALTARVGALDDKDQKQAILKLLGKLHHQKVWYRPKGKPYISG